MALKKATKRAPAKSADVEESKYYVYWGPRLLSKKAAIAQAQKQLLEDLEYGESNGMPVLFEAVGIVTVKGSPKFANLPEVN